jgi:DNA polymerase-4
MADEVWAWCDKAQSFGQTVTVKIKYADFRQVTRSRTLQNPITSQVTLRQVSLTLVRSVFPVAIGVRLVGVALSNFQNSRQAATAQLDLELTGTAV